MPFPKTASIEMPILQELVAIGGNDNVRFIYERLIAYFPQLEENELVAIKANKLPKWRNLVQKAGKNLDKQGMLTRDRGFWKITDKGRRKVKSEAIGFDLSPHQVKSLSHNQIQQMLLEIGDILGFYTEMEYEYYDVVWREVPLASRLSHVFEVQSKGNLDSAFAKLKRAYEAQRSKIFLVIANETDLKRAKISLLNEFQDMQKDLNLLTFAQIQKTHQNLVSIRNILTSLLES